MKLLNNKNMTRKNNNKIALTSHRMVYKSLKIMLFS